MHLSRIKRVVSPIRSWVARSSAKLLAANLTAMTDLEELYSLFYPKGYYFLPKHYYLPIPDEDDMSRVRQSDLIGVDMDDDAQLRFTRDVVLKYKSEMLDLPMRSTGDASEFHLINGAFMAGDAHAYYALVRHAKPRMIIEIGSGNSTLIANKAIAANVEEARDYQCSLVAIEPYPPDYLERLPHLTELKRSKLQDVDLEYFTQLGSGDILFIDSSHVLKSGGDVWLEYCEIVPRLNKGVYVHIHDISLPKPYPSVYYDSHLYWNEQYLVQALLTHNTRLKVVWAGTYLFSRYFDTMSAAFSPEYQTMRETYPLAESTSLWLQVT